MFNFVLQSSIRFHRYGRVLVSLLSNNYDHVIKKDAENFLLFCSWSLFFIPLFFNIFLAVVIFVLCVWVSVGFIRTAYVLLDSFFFLRFCAKQLMKCLFSTLALRCFFFFFSCILVWTDVSTCCIFVMPFVQENVNVCASVRVLRLVKVHRIILLESQSLGQTVTLRSGLPHECT